MQEDKHSIKSWAKDDRPREKLRYLGSENLSTTELLAILIHNGTRNKSAVELAREVLALSKNNLLQLGRCTLHDLMRVKGIGEAKALTIMAALELGRRRHNSTPLDKLIVRDSREIALYLQRSFQDLNREIFAVVFLNRSNRINHIEIVSEGGITGTVADPRIILKKALQEEAVNLILCHNHPSGSLKPSRADAELTLKIKEASKYFDIRVMDHIIVSEQGYFSFADEGIL